jgi:hypothetical protein
MFYTTAWCTGDEAIFRQSIPLESLGESMRHHGSSMPFTIVMLEGMHHLSPGYLRRLETLGFTLVDYQARFEEIIRDYPAIDNYYSRYERNCLLRWVAIRQLAAEGSGQCWHLDSDVILHTSLDELAADTGGKTFMLQGCPVLLSIADPDWFRAYEDNLAALNQDITGYSARAWAEREICKGRDARLANQTQYRNPIGSDQDLLEYLVSAQKIPQTPAVSLYDSRYYFIQNGLDMNRWHAAQYRPAAAGPASGDPLPRFIIDERQHLLIGAKQVPFTHFQNTFSLYTGIYLTIRQLHLPGALARKILSYDIRDEKFHTNIFFKLIGKINSKRASLGSRNSIIARSLRMPDPPLLSVYNLLLERGRG